MAIQSKGVLIIMPSLFTEDTYEQAIIDPYWLTGILLPTTLL